MKGLYHAIALGLLVAGSAHAQDVRITDDLPEVTFSANGQTFTIGRNQDPTATLTGDFAKTSRACPPFCILPIEVAPGVATLGELELITFLTDKVASGEGLLIDARLPEFYNAGTIPGAVNVPFSTLDDTNPYRADLLKALGAVAVGDSFDFSQAVDLTILGNGPWDDQGPRAVRNLLAAGYPADRLFHYRGGLQDWLLLGLTTQIPGSAG